MSRYTTDEPRSWQALHRPTWPHYWDERSISPHRSAELRKEWSARERWWWHNRVHGPLEATQAPHE